MVFILAVRPAFQQALAFNTDSEPSVRCHRNAPGRSSHQASLDPSTWLRGSAWQDLIERSSESWYTMKSTTRFDHPKRTTSKPRYTQNHCTAQLTLRWEPGPQAPSSSWQFWPPDFRSFRPTDLQMFQIIDEFSLLPPVLFR